VTAAPDLTTTTVRTVPIDTDGALAATLPEGQVFSWVTGGDGLIGWGELARYEWTRADAAAGATTWWRDWCRSLRVQDEVGLPGSGPVAFGSLAFDQRTGSSALIVPRVVVGRRGKDSWLTSYGDTADLPSPTPPRPVGPVSYADGAQTADQWMAAVAEAVQRIRSGDLHKVVLTRDLIATTQQPIDVRTLLNWLSEHYPSTWTYCVDGLVGATPELLVRRRGDLVDSRVLAGTSWRSGDNSTTDEAERRLMASTKDLGEHEYAVASTAQILAAYCSKLDVPKPTLLRLPNVSHLATNITGSVDGDVSSLELAGALHPTAAVCGTPTDVALDLIPQLERMDRGRYYGPIGWVDAAGDGDWGLALRGAQITGNRARMLAGGGIVAGSEPDRELAEAQAKFVVMRDALEARRPD
jgi:isochorismate synthase